MGLALFTQNQVLRAGEKTTYPLNFPLGHQNYAICLRFDGVVPLGIWFDGTADSGLPSRHHRGRGPGKPGSLPRSRPVFSDLWCRAILISSLYRLRETSAEEGIHIRPQYRRGGRDSIQTGPGSRFTAQERPYMTTAPLPQDQYRAV